MSENRYDEEFQRNDVDLWIKGGESAKQIADELWVSGNSLSNWKKKYLSEEGSPQQTALQLEVDRLKAENAELREEREFLKKSVLCFYY